MAKNTDTSIKLLVLYDILCKMTDEDHALSTNELIDELAKRGIAVSRKVLPSDIALLNKYGYEVCSYTKKARYYYAEHQFFDTAEITMLADVVKASKLTESRKEAIICKLYSTIGVYRHPDPDNIVFLDAQKRVGNPSIIYNIDAIETAIKQNRKISFLYFHLNENKDKVYHCDKKRYTVIFQNYDGTELSQTTYHYGDEVVVPETPVKPADNTYTYEFAGWDKEIVACAGDAIYTATYNPVYIEYTVIFKNYDGTELSKTTYHYGDEVVAPETPVKPADNTYTYEFAGWDNEVIACAGNATYTAMYDSVYIEYTVIFKNYDGAELSKTTYHYGDEVTAPNTPSKPADNTYTYKFAGWDKEVVACMGDTTYTATYDPVYIEYTVKFLDWNGSLLQERTYHYGDTIIPAADPARDNDETYIYTFKGWNKEVGSCTGNMTFTAQYDTAYIEYTVIFKNYDGTVLSRKTYHYGDALELPAEPSRSADETYTYRFKEWENLSSTCIGNAEYMAIFEEIYIEYTIVFEDYNGTILSEKTYHYGDAVQVPSDPVREADESFRYEFAGWDKEVIECAGDATYTATYHSVPVESSQNDDKGGLPGGAIAAIAVGSVAVVGGGGFAAYWFIFRKRRKL